MARTEGTRRFLSYGTNSLIFTVTVMAILVVGYYIIDSELSFRADWTRSGAHTLSEKTDELLERVRTDDRKITAIYFEVPTTGESAKDAFYTNQKVEDLLRAYEVASHGHLSFRLVDIYRDPLEVREYNVGPGTTVFERTVKGAPQRQIVKPEELVEGVPRRGQQPRFKGEQVFTTALDRLMDEQQRTACFLTGHEEWPLDAPSTSGLSRIKDQLELENYNTETLDLLARVVPEDDASVVVPEKCQVVVLAGPKQPITGAEIDALDAHVKSGGGLVVLVDPFTESGVDTLTERLGISLVPGLVYDKVSLQQPFNPVPEYGEHEITRQLAQRNTRTVLRQARGLEIEVGAVAVPLLSSSRESKSLVGVQMRSVDSAGNVPGPFPLAVAVSPKEGTGRAVIVGDSDLIRNDFVTRGPGNADFFLNAVHWAAGEEEKITITPKHPDIRTLDITVQEGYVILGLTAGVVPMLIGLLGGVIWWRRRRMV